MDIRDLTAEEQEVWLDLTTQVFFNVLYLLEKQGVIAIKNQD